MLGIKHIAVGCYKKNIYRAVWHDLMRPEVYFPISIRTCVFYFFATACHQPGLRLKPNLSQHIPVVWSSVSPLHQWGPGWGNSEQRTFCWCLSLWESFHSQPKRVELGSIHLNRWRLKDETVRYFHGVLQSMLQNNWYVYANTNDVSKLIIILLHCPAYVSQWYK